MSSVIAVVLCIGWMAWSTEPFGVSSVEVSQDSTNTGSPEQRFLPYLAPDVARLLLPSISSDDELSKDSMDCNEAINALLDVQTEEEFAGWQADMTSVLSQSASAEHLHVAALLEDDPVKSVALINRALAITPTDPMMLWSAVQICSKVDGDIGCNTDAWESQLLAADSQNSEVWARAAVSRHASGDTVGALQALEQAASVSQSTVYWPEYIAAIERGLAAGTNQSFLQRASYAFGIAPLPAYGPVVSLCREQSAADKSWGYACLAYGELLERQGKNDLSLAIARRLQQIMLAALGEVERAAAMEAGIQRERELMKSRPYSPVHELVMLSTPELFAEYLAALRSVGEAGARAQMGVAADKILERRPELRCVVDNE